MIQSDNRIFALHFFYLGITLTIIGTGFFKPNISSMVGAYKVGTVVEMLVLDCFIPELILEHCWRSCLCVLRNKSRLRLELCFLISCNCYGYWFNYFFITKHSLGPIGDSPLLDQTSSKEQKISCLCRGFN
jgi:POT family proton-dependent oligopeptide transporter